MTAIWSVLGVAVIATVLRDIFHELFHPAGTGTMSSLLMRVGWRAFHRAASHREGLMKLAGPSLMLLVLAVWSGSLAVGWALVFWPYMPEAFLLSTGLAPSSNSGFLDALYLSAVTLATLGYGDISPSSTPLRMLAPAEALVGFALLTVGISWVLSLYPILSQRRSLAHRLWLLRGTEQETGLSASDSATDPDALLQDLVTELTSIRRSMIQFPSLTTFTPRTRRAAFQ